MAEVATITDAVLDLLATVTGLRKVAANAPLGPGQARLALDRSLLAATTPIPTPFALLLPAQEEMEGDTHALGGCWMHGNLRFEITIGAASWHVAGEGAPGALDLLDAMAGDEVSGAALNGRTITDGVQSSKLFYEGRDEWETLVNAVSCNTRWRVPWVRRTA